MMDQTEAAAILARRIGEVRATLQDVERAYHENNKLLGQSITILAARNGFEHVNDINARITRLVAERRKCEHELAVMMDMLAEWTRGGDLVLLKLQQGY